MGHPTTMDSEYPSVHHPSPEEWDEAVGDALNELGITYEELKRQAEERDFSSADALSLWVIIGDRRS